MPNLIALLLLLLLSGNAYCNSLSIVHENSELRFAKQLVAGTHQQVTSHPRTNQTDVFRFYVKGNKGERIKISLPKHQTINQGKHKITINQFIFGCGLSNSGTAIIKNSGISDLLCIGAKATVLSKHSAGIYSSSISLEIKYL